MNSEFSAIPNGFLNKTKSFLKKLFAEPVRQEEAGLNENQKFLLRMFEEAGNYKGIKSIYLSAAIIRGRIGDIPSPDGIVNIRNIRRMTLDDFDYIKPSPN